MGTPYQRIYDAFLSKIKDYDFGEMDELLLEYDLNSLLKSSIPYFLCPKNNIFNLDEEKKEFKSDLTLEEINILAVLMKREWFKRNISDTDVIQQKYSEIDFEFKSQANHLNALCNAEIEVIEREVKNLISNYSRVKQGQIFNYKNLVGK